jgi:glycosyltransferase involved in cell wall biosynthesis
MKILHISSRLPWPLTDGAAICMFQLAHAMASHGHAVHLLTLDDLMEDATPLEQFVTLHRIPFHPPPNWAGALRTLFDARPYTQAKRERKEVYDYLDRLHAEEKFDIVIADEAHIACYGSYMKRRYGLPYLFRSHNVEYEIYERHLRTVTNPAMRAYLNVQTGRWKRYEIEQVAQADVTAAITRRDSDKLAQLVPGARVETFPAAVDLDAFPFVNVEARDSASVLVIGDMTWPPNRDAAIWFANEILPLIHRQMPEVVCHLVGGNAPLRQLPRPDERFRIEGRVPSIQKFYSSATVGLIPLRVGGGMRVKMVEMMGAGLPVVSTSQGAEGNEAIPGNHYLLADTPEAFAAAVVRLLRDREERHRMASSANEFVRAYYSTREIGSRFEQLVQELVAAHVGSTEVR